MRVCPKCSAFYADDSAAFCLVEGTPLVSVDPRTGNWTEGTRVLEEKEQRRKKHKRKLMWRRILITAMTMLVATRVVYVLAVDGWVYLKREPPPPPPSPLLFPSPSPSPSPTASPSVLPVSAVYQISGRVMMDGKPLGKVKITLDGSKIINATTGADGKYRFIDLPAGGNYTITPASKNMKFPASSINKLTKDETVDFVGLSQLFKISGHVASNGNVVEVILSGLKSDRTKTDPTGRYSFSNLPAGGPYTITPNAPNVKFTPQIIINLIKDELVNFDRAERDPPPPGECSREDRIREEEIIANEADHLFKPGIEKELAAKLVSPIGIRSEPVVELGKVDTTLNRTCTRADVKLGYTWSIKATRLKRAEMTTFVCHKTGAKWGCGEPHGVTFQR
jgi:hypothetical protein